MQFTIRPIIVPQDYADIAAVLFADWSGADTAEELAYADANRDPRYHHATFVAEMPGEIEPLIVGVAFVGHDTLAHRAGKFQLNLRVYPDWQGHGIGKALYQAVLDHLVPLAPWELQTKVWHAHPRALRFLTERGFAEVWRRLDLELDVTKFDFSPYAGLEEKLQAQGIVVKTYTDLADDPDRLVKLYELDWALWQSIPYGEPVAKRSLTQFTTDEVNHPTFLPDACFIAVQGNDFIGYLKLIEGDGDFSTDMTGVHASYRGLGVATLLKLYSIRYALAHGNRALSTQNDAVNQAMLRLNKKLGFVQTGADLRFVKRLE
jgi:mycothiol synthase